MIKILAVMNSDFLYKSLHYLVRNDNVENIVKLVIYKVINVRLLYADYSNLSIYY